MDRGSDEDDDDQAPQPILVLKGDFTQYPICTNEPLNRFPLKISQPWNSGIPNNYPLSINQPMGSIAKQTEQQEEEAIAYAVSDNIPHLEPRPPATYTSAAEVLAGHPGRGGAHPADFNKACNEAVAEEIAST